MIGLAKETEKLKASGQSSGSSAKAPPAMSAGVGSSSAFVAAREPTSSNTTSNATSSTSRSGSSIPPTIAPTPTLSQFPGIGEGPREDESQGDYDYQFWRRIFVDALIDEVGHSMGLTYQTEDRQDFHAVLSFWLKRRVGLNSVQEDMILGNAYRIQNPHSFPNRTRTEEKRDKAQLDYVKWVRATYEASWTPEQTVRSERMLRALAGEHDEYKEEKAEWIGKLEGLVAKATSSGIVLGTSYIPELRKELMLRDDRHTPEGRLAALEKVLHISPSAGLRPSYEFPATPGEWVDREEWDLRRQSCGNCKQWEKQVKDARGKMKPEVKFQRCSRCKIETYCSAECQKAHWSKHKARCAEWSEAMQVKLAKEID